MEAFDTNSTPRARGSGWLALIEGPVPDPQLQRKRIRVIERNIMLPIKGAALIALAYFLFFMLDDLSSVRVGTEQGIRWLVMVEAVQTFYFFYAIITAISALALIYLDRLKLSLVQWTLFTVSLIDAIFAVALTMITGGFSTLLWWVFLGLLIRNAISLPVPALQIVLNLLISLCYVLAGLLEAGIGLYESSAPADSGSEPFILRTFLLLFITACCYTVQALIDRQQQAEEEAREFSLRQDQLHAAGRLAAEIAHRLKNPLGIINNAAFTLQRGLKDDRPVLQQQISIIREEVEKSDRIITELMGYAQLIEGKVERLDVREELDRAIQQVFPPGSDFQLEVKRRYSDAVPVLMMQRGHLSEILVNLLQNSREIMTPPGLISVTADAGENYSVLVTVTDSGPGIAEENLDKIFEPYFTTKMKGSGLGLAIVKHNMEIYGGSVRAEIGPTQGARFVLHFRAKTIMRFHK